MPSYHSSFWKRWLSEPQPDYQALDNIELEEGTSDQSNKEQDLTDSPELQPQSKDELQAIPKDKLTHSTQLDPFRVETIRRTSKLLTPFINLCIIGSLISIIFIFSYPQLQPRKPISTNPDLSIPPVILHWIGEDNLHDPAPEDCLVRIHVTPNQTEAEAVIWPSQHPWPKPDPGARKDQKLAIWSLENAKYYPIIDEARESIWKQDGKVDYEMTYRLGSDVPLPYTYGWIDFRQPALPFRLRKPDKLVAAFISNCGALNDRLAVLTEMLKLMPGQIDSFGRCLHNADPQHELERLSKIPGREFNVTELDYWHRKMTIIKNYKFTIAFENADEEDYVTEKYYQALSAGSIPLHLGQPAHAFDKFLPASNAAINVRDYNSTEDLVKDLLAISNDEKRFNSMISWKNKPFLPFFQMLVDWGREGGPCRYAQLLRGVWSNPYAHPIKPSKHLNSSEESTLSNPKH